MSEAAYAGRSPSIRPPGVGVGEDLWWGSGSIGYVTLPDAKIGDTYAIWSAGGPPHIGYAENVGIYTYGSAPYWFYIITVTYREVPEVYSPILVEPNSCSWGGVLVHKISAGMDATYVSECQIG
jgi:hypothetical protein